MEAALKWGETRVARPGGERCPAKIELLHLYVCLYVYIYIYMYNKIYCTMYIYIYIHIDPLPICLVYFATCLRTTMRFWAIHQGVEYLVYAESRLPSQSHSMVFVFLGESSICWAILGKHIECQCAKCSMLLLQGELVFLNFLTVYNWPHKSSANHNVGKFPVCQNGWQRKVFFLAIFM